MWIKLRQCLSIIFIAVLILQVRQIIFFFGLGNLSLTIKKATEDYFRNKN
jgi:uncharacterized membrane protein YesL